MLFEPFRSDALHLKNRLVMAPLTRSRAVESNTPNALMVEYYAQRAGAGLIITEGTSPSPNGLGYARIPGLFNAAHVAGVVSFLVGPDGAWTTGQVIDASGGTRL